MSPASPTDAYLDTIPPRSLKAGAGVMMVLGFVVLVLTLRLVLADDEALGGAQSKGIHLVAGLACFVCAWGVRNGNIVIFAFALLILPLVAWLSYSAFVTGAIAGLVGVVLAPVDFALLALNVGSVNRIRRARAAIQRGS